MREKEYSELLAYYKACLEEMDCFLFNSHVSKEVYSKSINPKQSLVIPVTHSGIRDNRTAKRFNKDVISLGFIGNLTTYKGFSLLKEILLTLYKEGVTNWTLLVYGTITGEDKDCPLIKYKGKYKAEDLKFIYGGMDLLIVPSLWKETFSLVTLEAISYGVPAIVSETVGAKDVVKEYSPQSIFATKEDLHKLLITILKDVSYLEEYNNAILKKEWIYAYAKHTEAVKKAYKKVLNDKTT